MAVTRLEGFNEIMNILQTLRERVPDQYDEALENVSEKIKVDAKQRVRSKTGKLKASIQKKKKTQSGITTYEVSAGGRSAPHAHLVEFGHRQVLEDGTVVGDVPARPFLRSAFEDNKDEIINQLTSIIDNAISGG